MGQEKMTIDEAMEKINAAAAGEALSVAQNCIDQLSDDDRDLVGGDLEEMAIALDDSDPVPA